MVPFKLCKRCFEKERRRAVKPGRHPVDVEEDESEEEEEIKTESLEDNGDTCLLSGCTKSKFLDLSRTVPVLHDFCCREHALQFTKAPIPEPPPAKPLLVKLDKSQKTYTEIAQHFHTEWVKQKPSFPQPPQPIAIYAVNNPALTKKFQKYGEAIRQAGQSSNSDLFFHGTKLSCDLLSLDECCDEPDCGICGICKVGFDERRIGTNIPRFKRFGHGIYLAPNSSKCHDYTHGLPEHGVRAQLLCLVACGAKHELLYDNTKLSQPPPNCHSVHGRAGGNLNYDEIVVYQPAAVLPHYIIVYEREGVDKIAL